jgi:hypothetical protein
MDHPAEIALHLLLQDVAAGNGDVSDEILDLVAADVKDALKRQLSSKRRGEQFTLRMSNLGRDKCQLWFDKNRPEEAAPFQPFFLMQMLIGDITEAVFKGLLRAANVKFGDAEHVVLNIAGTEIKGTYDLYLDGKIDDVKSASPWSYENKFESFETLNEGDSFGYVAQLVGYATAKGVDVGGWWVINKSTGAFKYVAAEGVDVEKVLGDIEDTVNYINNDEPFERCYTEEDESFYGKLTGNKIVPKGCHFCSYRKACWDNVRTLPKLVTQARTKNPAPTDYTYVHPDHEEKAKAYEG